MAALEQFKLQTGHVLVPKGFIVPSNGTAAAEWSEELRGMHLGATVKNVRQKVCLASPDLYLTYT